jgi:hypothetical protein
VRRLEVRDIELLAHLAGHHTHAAAQIEPHGRRPRCVSPPVAIRRQPEGSDLPAASARTMNVVSSECFMPSAMPCETSLSGWSALSVSSELPSPRSFLAVGVGSQASAPILDARSPAGIRG